MKKMGKIAIAVVALLVVLALALAFNYSSTYGKGWFGSSGEIQINVNNLFSDEPIDVTLTVNGNEVGKKTLTNGADWNFAFKPLFFGDNATYEIVLDVHGSIIEGDQTRTVTLQRGETVPIDFFIVL
ncbi:hypothetical protein [Methanomassiliicoccus luminyensis]|uniref:hypothetical protein n=1 Tax=Methanomassiliicoccus luminyensis TaxID=1080712 RepID=UPI000378533E|nr:hypothetical protein [Methanomassiliicoccus luminyensis]